MRDPKPGTITLWRPTGKVELELVAKSGWKRWPPRLSEQPIFYPVLNRGYATQITREWNVPARGIGFVTCFEVRQEFIDSYKVHQVGGKEHLEYWIPAEELDNFNANIVGAIRQVSEFRGPITDEEFNQAEAALKLTWPKAWRKYLQSASWLRKGWLTEECYLKLHTPAESVDLAGAWEPCRSLPGIIMAGDGGGPDHLALDVRKPEPRLISMPNVTTGWTDAIEQAESIEAFIAQLEDCSFVFKS